MKIYEKVYQLVVDSGFSTIEVNVSSLKVGYKILEDASYLIAIFDDLSSDLMEDQYVNIKRQLTERFHSHYGKEVKLLSIICTEELDKTKHVFASYSEVWLIDKKNYRLLIYENQQEDFLSIRESIYRTLDSIKSEFIHNSNMDIKDTHFTNQHYNKYEDGYSYEENYKDNKSRKPKYEFVYIIIVLINLAVHLIMNLKPVVSSSIINDLVLYWRACFYEQEYYRVFTYMFLHSNVDHLANNMFLLFVLGKNVEMVLGKFKFITLYILSGVLAGFGSITYNMYQNNNVVSVGASGAIFGIVGGMAYLIISNKNNIRNISKRQILLFIVFSLYGGFTSSRIDNVAHITGLIAGIALTAILDKVGRKT